jgi:insertion element IS1 protein InsB
MSNSAHLFYFINALKANKMMQSGTSCYRVSDGVSCPNCKEKRVVKNGTTKNKKQQYYCKDCGKRFIAYYSYNAYKSDTNNNIVLFTKEGLGIRSTARVLKISTTTLLRRIIAIAESIKPPAISMHKAYEVDEMRSYIKSKDRLIWIVYALERETRKVISFHVGRRTNNTLNVVLKTVRFSNPRAIYTDRLKHYRYLIDTSIHKTKRYGINHIERKNLSLRTHLKRLNRRTICFSRSLLVLVSILKIYFWV